MTLMEPKLHRLVTAALNHDNNESRVEMEALTISQRWKSLRVD